MSYRFVILAILAVFVSACVSNEKGPSTASNKVQLEKSSSNSPEKVFAENERKCAGNDGSACLNLATQYRKGLGVHQDKEKTLDLYIKACELDVYGACALAGGEYFTGKNVPKDRERSYVFHGKACSGDIASSCNIMGLALTIDKKASNKDLAEAKRYFNKSCKLGDVDGCKFKRLYDDAVAGKDTSRSAYDSEYEYQCYDGDYESCAVQADLYLKGNGASKNIAEAAKFYSRACLGGKIGRACHQLGLMLTPGKYKAGNLKASLAYLDRGCDANYEDSCGLLTNIYLFGQNGAPIDPKKALMYRDKLRKIMNTNNKSS